MIIQKEGVRGNSGEVQPLILDDLFLVPLDTRERPLLLDIIEDRHGRKSIIITSQVPVSNWYDAIGDPTVADAILDRIVHSAHQIKLTGESVRKILPDIAIVEVEGRQCGASDGHLARYCLYEPSIWRVLEGYLSP